MLSGRCPAGRAGAPETAGSGTATSARGHAAGSRLAFPTTRFRAWGGQPVSPHDLALMKGTSFEVCAPSACGRRPGRTPMGAALLRRRPKGLLPAARQELLDPSKVWWGGRRGRLADRPRYSISVSLGVVPLVLPRRGSPSTHRSRGWLRSTRSFRTASAPTQFATRRIRARAWMKQRYWVAPACTSELHHGRGPGTARPFDDAGGDGTQAPPCRRTRPRG